MALKRRMEKIVNGFNLKRNLSRSSIGLQKEE